MKTIKQLTCLGVLILFFSSCGVVSKARYGNGLKLNVELNGFKKDKAIPAKDRMKSKSLKARQTADEINHEFPKLLKPESRKAQGILKAGNEQFVITVPKENRKINFTSQLKAARQLLKKEINKIVPERIKQKVPIEPTTKLAAVLFYGGILLLQVLSLILVAPAILSTLCFWGMLLGFILALVGLRKIRMNRDQYRGYGLAISIVVVTGLFVLIMLTYLMVLLIIFASL